MPPKKRKGRTAGPPLKKRHPPIPSDPSGDDSPNVQDIQETVRDLFRKAVVSSSREERDVALHRAVEETSALRQFVWPALLELAHEDKVSAKEASLTSLLFASLVSWENREGVNLDTALDFVVATKDEESLQAAWNLVCEHVFIESQHQKRDDFDYSRLAISAHFLMIVWACVQQQNDSEYVISFSKFSSIRAAVERQASSWDTWHWMPNRTREFLVRRSPELEKEMSDKKPSHPPYVVVVIQHILHLVEGERLKLRAPPAGDDDDSQDNTDDREEALRIPEWTFLHRSLELLIDLVSSQWKTRRILIPYLDAVHFSVRCRMALGTSSFSVAEENMLLTQQLLERLDKSLASPVNLETGESLNYVDLRSQYHSRAGILQKMCNRYFPEELPDIIYSGVGLLCQSNCSFLREALGGLSDQNLLELLHKMRLVDKTTDSGSISTLLLNREFLLQVLERYLTIPPDPVEELQSFPLYPTEQVLWDFARIPPSHFSLLPSSHVLSLPKLQTRFLSFADYLCRNFELMRLESAYEIRSDLVDAIRRLRPVVRQTHDMGADEELSVRTEFTGWARMALELDGLMKITKVEKPPLGGLYPSKVLAELTVDLARCGSAIRREWDGLSEFDNLFLVAIDARKMTGESAPSLKDFHRHHGTHRAWVGDQDRLVPDEDDRTFPQRFGVTLVRGCMVLSVKDEEGNVLNEPTSSANPVGTKRTFLVSMDPTQFSVDSRSPTGTDMYQSINLVIRRDGRVNNFKAVLETIRGLLAGTGSINRVLPSFFQHVLLGQGSPDSASYKSDTVRAYAKNTAGVEDPDSLLDFGDTFIDEDHFRSSFPGAEIHIDTGDEAVPESRQNYRVKITVNDGKTRLQAVAYPVQEGYIGNQVRFTPTQVEAIRSGLSPGMTLIMGPPGTGKTDVAVQVIANLYHSFPNQRTVVITHSNAALNDIFEKIVSRGDMDEKFFLRLGSGERDLQVQSTHDFTKAGRVAYCFQKRGELLEKVQQLSESLGLSGKAERGADGSPGYTCETADYFYRHHVKSLMKVFDSIVANQSLSDSADLSSQSFPFSEFFEVSDMVSVNEARKMMASIHTLFADLASYRPFELLRTQRQRADYLLVKQARVVAMTCTHAAIARSYLVSLGFEYDNVVVEEAGQMVEIEGFIPLLLQQGGPDDVSSASVRRLKRVCLMGDHNQLPPVIKNMSLCKFSTLDQSLFTRLIRLGVPFIQLDRQGRARAEIASLYSWRYQNLGNLDHVLASGEFSCANAGFARTMQLIDVGDFEGRGESSPTAYFYQNVGEAEYSVALFQFMVLIGHSPSSISILTTYNGQKSLIDDILSQRCGDGTPLAGIRPRSVSTVDQYQGQQNDIILLSLVRTNTVGHLRDVRRLVVAVSRARRGLYIFCRRSLFDSVFELKPTFGQFTGIPSKLQLVLGENHPTERTVAEKPRKENLFEVEDVTHLGEIVHKMQEDLVSQMDNAS